MADRLHRRHFYCAECDSVFSVFPNDAEKCPGCNAVQPIREVAGAADH